MRKYFVWDPQRAAKFIRISAAPRDSAGEELSLIDGMKLSPEVSISWQVEKVKKTPDFLYSVGLHLLVSEKAWAVISGFNVSGVHPYPFSLLAPDGSTLGRFLWLNTVERLDLLDREQSSVEEKRYGLRINRFVVADRNHRDLDLFEEENTGWRIFTDRLVLRIKEERLTGANFEPLEKATMF